MDFVRFTGELVIYYVLIAIGGVACAGMMELTFRAIGISVDPVLQAVLPAAAVAGVMIAAWLVEAKQSVIENMAPVLTRLFSPLCVVLLLAFIATVTWTGRGIGVDRDVLIAFDLLLVLVLGLLVYAISARDPLAPRGPFDVVQVVLVAAALVTDGVALWAIVARIGELGLSANRVAALGENVLLLVNLAWSLVIYVRFLRGRGAFDALERWQTDYLPVYAGWAAFVVIVFPPLFAWTRAGG